ERNPERRPQSPCRKHHGREQHEEPVGDRAADQGGDHSGFAGAMATISNAPSFVWRNSNATACPTAMPFGRPPAGSLNPMVMAGQRSESIGSCESITSSFSIASTLPLPRCVGPALAAPGAPGGGAAPSMRVVERSEEHTSELQSRLHLVCRLLLEK